MCSGVGLFWEYTGLFCNLCWALLRVYRTLLSVYRSLLTRLCEYLRALSRSLLFASLCSRSLTSLAPPCDLVPALPCSLWRGVTHGNTLQHTATHGRLLAILARRRICRLCGHFDGKYAAVCFESENHTHSWDSAWWLDDHHPFCCAGLSAYWGLNVSVWGGGRDGALWLVRVKGTCTWLLFIYMCVYICIYIYMYVCMCICVYIYVYIYIYI